MKPYTPREGSLPDKVIGTLDNSPPGTLLTVRQIADDFGVARSSVANCLKPAVKHGVLFIGKQDGIDAYGLGPGDGFSAAAASVDQVPARARTTVAADPAGDVDDDAAGTTQDAPVFSLWCDGTLHLHGITPRPDGIFELSLADAHRLARLLHGFTFDQ